jgi:two-component sensor histidine kinase
LKIDWRERGGPPPAESRANGFGTKLIKAVIERQLNGHVEHTFAPEGLRTDITIPLGHERWPQGRPAADALDALPPL